MSLYAHITTLPMLRVNLIASIAAVAWRGGRSSSSEQQHELELLERLRAGDESAFLALVDRHQASMIRLARSFVSSSAVAEEVVQDTWLGVLRGIDTFAGRSTLRTWLLKILVNRARSTGAKESRSVAIGDATPAVDRMVVAEAGGPFGVA